MDNTCEDCNFKINWHQIVLFRTDHFSTTGYSNYGFHGFRMKIWEYRPVHC